MGCPAIAVCAGQASDTWQVNGKSPMRQYGARGKETPAEAGAGGAAAVEPVIWGLRAWGAGLSRVRRIKAGDG